jgi:hypothetical protein
MITWLEHFALTLLDTCKNVLPIVVIIIGFQLLVLRKPLPNPLKTLIGFGYVLIGLAFFFEGLNMALFPLGSLMAKQLTSLEFLGVATHAKQIPWQKYSGVYLFAASLGFAAALAEPTLLAIARKAEAISGGTIRALSLRLVVAIGLALGLSIGTLRIVTGANLYHFMIAGYAIVLVQSAFASKTILGLAYDSGCVTTSTITIPLVTALGIGLASNVPGRSPLLDGFGLLAFASLFPIISVLGYAQIAGWRSKRSLSSNSSK